MSATIEPGLRQKFVLAGDATFTIEGRDARFTYRVRSAGTNTKRKSSATHWVYVLCGPDNTNDYVFMGGVYPVVRARSATGFAFFTASSSQLSPAAPSAVAFSWFFRHIEDAKVAVFHAGTCGRCGKLLTTPESIRTGLGPVCAGRT